MAQEMGNQPILVLGEDSERTQGRDAQTMNITAGKAVADSVRTTLGPKGMDKMLVDSMGDVVVTNDGVTILDEMDVEHPAAKMIVEIAETQEEETGDGTTTAVTLAGELLSEAEDLIEQDIHPGVIASGYRKASEKAREILRNEAIEVSADDTEYLEKVAKTSMTGKGAEDARDTLAELVVKAVQSVEIRGEVDTDNIKIESVVGGAIEDSELVEGVIIDKERVHSNMPRSVEDAKIAVIDTALEIEETETDAEISVSSADQLQSILDQEEEKLREMVDKIKESGANVVFCQKGIDDMAQHFLAKEGILAVRRAKKSDIKRIARGTGARIVSKVDEINEEVLGYAGKVEERDISGDRMLFIEDCENPKSVSFILRGGTEHVVDEVERSIEDGIGVVRTTIEKGWIVPGGGAPEIEVSHQLRDFAESVEGREQLAVEAFADAVEVIPRTLAENAGLDPIDSLVELRSHHDKEEFYAGLDAYSGDVKDMEDEGVVEPLSVKTQAIESATEASSMILRIDDVIAAGDIGGDDEDVGGGPGGGPGAGAGMGGL